MWHERLGTRLRTSVLNYYFNISLTHRYTYTEVPKCACTTLKGSLGRLEMESSGIGEAVIDEFAASPHRPSYQSPFVKPYQLPPEVFDDIVESESFTRFAFVRNPFTRTASAYLDKVIHNRPALDNIAKEISSLRGVDPAEPIDGATVSFAEFVTALSMKEDPSRLDPHFRPQTVILADDLYPYDFIGRLERFDADYDGLMDRLGLSHIGYSRHPWGKNARSHLHDLYDDETERLVLQIFGQDFVRLGYPTELAAATSGAEVQTPVK